MNLYKNKTLIQTIKDKIKIELLYLYRSTKVKLRRKKIIRLYKRCYEESQPVFVVSNNRGLGLTTFLVEESVKTNIPIVCSTSHSKKYIAKMIYDYITELNQTLCKHGVTTTYFNTNLRDIENNMVFSIGEVKNGILRGMRNINVLVDNSCTTNDAIEIKNNGGFIQGGFITIPEKDIKYNIIGNRSKEISYFE